MALENYRDCSTGRSDINAGFQFEFYCCGCGRKWKTPFKPYRIGQLTGLLGRFAFLFSNAGKTSRITGTAADYGSSNAKQAALNEAMPQAMNLYANCAVCKSGFCMDCLDAEGACDKCAEGSRIPQDHSSGHDGPNAGGTNCPNCNTAGSGSRFCAECGFDLASTHKSCPGCGAIASRAARFCGDCGHGF